MGRVGHDSFDGHIVREDFVVCVENCAALRINDLFVNVFFSSQPGVLVVLDHLEIDQSKRKTAEDGGEGEARQRATDATVPLHGLADLLATGWIASSQLGG